MFIPRTLSEREDAVTRSGAGRALAIIAMVAVALFLVLSANITLGQENLAVGQIAPRDIRAQRDQTFTSESRTEAARDAAEDEVTPVTETVKSPTDNQEDQLLAFDTLSRRVLRILELRDSGSIDDAEVLSRLNDDAEEIPFAQRQAVASMSVQRWNAVSDAGRVALQTVLSDRIRQDELFATRSEAHDLVTTDLEGAERDLAGDLAAALVEPTERIDETLTQQAIDQRRSEVPAVEVTILAGQRIVNEGDPITIEQFEMLDALGLTRPRVEMATVFGNALLAILIATLMVAYLWRFEPAIWHRNRSVLLFFLALVATALVLRIAADRTLWAFVVPTTATVLLVGILLQGGAGAAMAAALAVLAGVMNRDALELAVYVLAGGLAALIAMARAERLNAFFRVFAVLAVTNIVVVTAFSLLEPRDLAAVAQLGAAGILNAILAVVGAVGSFAVLGNLFGIMTVFQMLELANPSNRLLRRLLLETPGTYHHSVMVGNLAERAAETIGADPLLARVAAYYHDIGKMKNPLAFIENQAGARNIHDDLTADTSARIIAGHIRDGIDLGYENGLPVQIIGFIPQHHGTSVMTFFHTKALSEAGGREELVDERSYRYPGPKPQSREAAILMLADGVEASVRSLDEKDEESIRGMVNRIVDARVEDGQLDDADLTLKDIALIKDAFVGQLLGMYHSRIKYPDNVVPMEQRREQA
ncbi:MAG TPA: HDIG domain-containing protein [Candidatus Limnocylindria bacterium]|nr:HDIG domain-containing protein [Candidatus Limnocylindria bacterium]